MSGEKKKDNSCLNCCAAIFTLGIHPVLKWVWTAEETYGKGDPRRILVNVHTERFKKVALLVGGFFAIAEAASLATVPDFLYCANRCSEVPEDSWADGALGEIFPCREPSDEYGNVLASPPPSPPLPPSSPSLINSAAFNDIGNTFTKQMRVRLLNIRVSVNTSTAAKADILGKYWECQDGSQKPDEGAKAGFWVDLMDVLPFLNIRFVIGFIMIGTVVMWFILRAALFNVIKGNKLCNCCNSCCPKFTKCLKVSSKKFLGLLCPLALNVIMVLNNNMLLDVDQSWYNANMDFFSIVMMFSSILVFMVSFVLMLVGMIASCVPACFAACARACGAKSCSPLGIITAVFYSIMVFSLYFFSMLGIIVIAVQILEGLLSGEVPTANIFANLFLSAYRTRTFPATCEIRRSADSSTLSS